MSTPTPPNPVVTDVVGTACQARIVPASLLLPPSACPFTRATRQLAALWQGVMAALGDVTDRFVMIATLPAHQLAHARAGWQLARADENDRRVRFARSTGDAKRAEALRLRNELADVFAPLAVNIASRVEQLLASPAMAELQGRGAQPSVCGFGAPRMVRFTQRLRYDPRLHDRLTQQLIVRQAPHPDVAIVGGATQFRQFNRSFDEVLHTGVNPLDLGVVIGDGGVSLAAAIVSAGQIMRGLVLDELLPRANALTDEHAQLLRDFTIHEGVANTLLEGVQALEASVAVLTARHTTGLDSDALLAAIDKEELIGKLSAGPLAFVGPMNTFGIVPKETVCLGADGRLQLAPSLVTLMRRARGEMVMNYQHLRASNVGCPLLRTSSATDKTPYVAQGSPMGALSHAFVALVRRCLASPSVPKPVGH